MLKLYKFRALANCQDYKRIKGIIETGKFWCSPLWEQNDPMEGVYTYLKNETLSNSKNIFTQKNKYKICSFSGDRALNDPRMWGYYANGLKGIAVEIEIDQKEVKKIDYDLNHWFADIKQADIEKIITSKLEQWAFEDEYRFLHEGESNCVQIGRITGVYFGNPYSRLENKKQIIESSSKNKIYQTIKDKIINISASKGYPCYDVEFRRKKDKFSITWTIVK